jgi:hypothetical protein
MDASKELPFSNLIHDRKNFRCIKPLIEAFISQHPNPSQQNSNNIQSLKNHHLPITMKLLAIIFATLAIFGFVAAATTNEEDEACWLPNGPCTKVAQAVASAKGILAEKGGKHDPHSKRAEDYLLAAINDAEHGSVSKRSPLPAPEPGRWW